MTDAEMKELASELSLEDALAEDKPQKHIELNPKRLEYERKQEEEEERKNDPAYFDEEEAEGEEAEEADEQPEVRADTELSASTYMIYYELLIKLINQMGAKKVPKMSDEEMDKAEYLKSVPREKRSEEQNILIGRYNRLKDAQVQIIEENKLDAEEKRLAKEAIKLICEKRNWTASPEMAAITVLGQQIGVRALKLFFN